MSDFELQVQFIAGQNHLQIYFCSLRVLLLTPVASGPTVQMWYLGDRSCPEPRVPSLSKCFITPPQEQSKHCTLFSGTQWDYDHLSR